MQVELPLTVCAQMDIYTYHLKHPDLSQFQVALAMGVQKYTVWLAFQHQRIKPFEISYFFKRGAFIAPRFFKMS